MALVGNAAERLFDVVPALPVLVGHSQPPSMTVAPGTVRSMAARRAA
jgi:hypothetical protein